MSRFNVTYRTTAVTNDSSIPGEELCEYFLGGFNETCVAENTFPRHVHSIIEGAVQEEATQAGKDIACVVTMRMLVDGKDAHSIKEGLYVQRQEMDDLLDKLLDSLGTNRNAQIVLERNGAWHIHEVLEDEDEPVSE